MTYQVGISGLRRGAGFARVFPLLPDCRLAAACDPDPATLDAFGARFPEARLFATYEEMLDAGLDIAVVASPVPLHAAQTLAALDAGCHVLQEVCLAQTVEECRAIFDAVQAHPRQQFMLAENCNYWAHILSWRELWNQGTVGELLYAEAEYVHDVRGLMHRDGKPTWRATLPPIHYCTHSLGPLLKVTGARCVSACGLATPSKIDPGTDRYDLEVGIFQTDGGATVKILAGFRVQREPAFHYYSIYGTRGCLETARPPAAMKTHAYLESVPHLQGMIEIPLGLDVPRAPAGAHTALDMALPGLCAHQSALQGGHPVEIPDWR
jgi:predicted dehydrogenase